MSNTEKLSDNPLEWPIEVLEALDYLISKGYTWQDYKAALELQQTYDAALVDYRQAQDAEPGADEVA